MSFITFVLLIVILVLLVKRGDPGDQDEAVRSAVSQRDSFWRQYITAFKERVKTDTERALIDRILTGDASTVSTDNLEQREQAATKDDPHTSVSAGESVAEVEESRQPIDNALLLLYLGAFLFVASAGLFVAFGGFSGGVRAFIIAIVASLFYFGGLYLHRQTSRLQQAGISFAAIGMAIAPLVGLSVYSYVLDQTSGALVWFITSGVVLALYAHALYRLRSSFISYLLIFSFVSLLQSAISIFDVPVYYFIWTLILAGLILQVISRYVADIGIDELKEPSHISAQIIIPLSIFVSLISVTSEGYAQLAVSLLFASAYYGLEALSEESQKYRLSLFQTSHGLALSGLSVGAFSLRQSLSDVSIALVVATIVHGALFMSRVTISSPLRAAISTNALVATIAMTLFALGDPVVLLVALAATALLGYIVSVRVGQPEGVGFTTLAVGAIPFVYGLGVVSPALGASQMALLGLLGPLFLFVLRFWLHQSRKDDLLSIMAVPYLVVIAFSLLPVVLSSQSLVSLFGAVVLAGMCVALGSIEKNVQWSVASGLTILAFVFHAFLLGQNPVLTVSLFVAVVWNIALALHYREEATRWIGSLLWLLMPWGMAAPGFSFEMTPTWYTWSFIGVLVGFLLARAIARGVIARSEGVKLSSYESGASVVYVIGYSIAGALALLSAVIASVQHVALVSLVLMVVSGLLALYIEKQPVIISAVPILAQVFVLSIVNPDLGSSVEVTIYLLLSQLVALTSYMMNVYEVLPSVTGDSSWKTASRWMLYVAPFSVVFVGRTELLMPVGLATAGLVTLFENKNESQGTKEAVGWIIVAALLWTMWYFGVRNLQAYSHVLAAVLAVYAYVRYSARDALKGDEYLQYMFFAATIPLVLQALGGTSGDIYGWWLILEQIGFILLGMVIGKPFLSKWGLYVSVAAVLYQLRDLGWAALTVLAVVIIAIALYYLGKQDPQD